jgi:hypothetical protein
MNSYISEEDWDHIVNQSFPIEFGWIGVDISNRLGYFSNFNEAYMPKKVVSSFGQYLKLAELINSLPEITASQLYVDRKGPWYDDWHYYSRRGIPAYDYHDVHREAHEKKDRYDLITVPDIRITCREIPGIEEFEAIIPRFDIIFCGHLSFKELQRSER